MILEVWKGLYRGTPVAVKSLKGTSNAAQTFLREAQLMTYVYSSVLCVYKSLLIFLESNYEFLKSLNA